MSFLSLDRHQSPPVTTIFTIYDLCNKPEEEVIQWLQGKGLLTSYYECPICKKQMNLTQEEMLKSTLTYIWKCSSQEGIKHTTKRSIRRGTWFERSNLSLPDILQLSYYWYRAYPFKQVQHELQTKTAHTILEWYSLCKGVCVDTLSRQRKPIGGHGFKIELFECNYWRRTQGEDHTVQDYWIFSGLEQDTTNCFLFKASDKTPLTLKRLIEKFVLPGTIICSDIWKDFKMEEENFSEFITEQEITLRDMKCGDGNTTEGIWTMIKRQFPDAECNKTMFDAFLSEFMYRRTLSKAKDGFLQLLSDVTTVYKPTMSG